MVQIDTNAVRAAVDERDLALEPENQHLQSAVQQRFPEVFDAWVKGGDVDPYGTLTDDDRTFTPDGVELSVEQLRDVQSANCHTIRQAVERVTGIDPSSSDGIAALQL
ncbi:MULTISPECIES: hypothetical protein [Mycolicibacter]|uniref:HNH endonuclease n=2 Tax=Mycolicibacter TaxID=1073531 RepID=A0ABU5XMA6_9MYCO|nr:MULTISPECIES: hypothetical protein [unclassified Mycolicibacter]MEB3023334.1 hypothetical protein [Mycolicibacter sp. MYC098]MEB3035130.1 hypothetical protein [Mycolicibacter sp. MYC340]